MTNPKMRSRSLATLTLTGGAAVLLLAACGSSGGSSTTSSSSSGAPAGTSGQPGQLGGGNSQIQKCLKAAGITGAPGSGAPSGMPSGSPPSGMPSGSMPSGMSAPAGAGPINAKVSKALKACGISIPSGAGASSS